MEYLRGWTAMRQDADWMRKIGIGALLFFSSSFIPILGQVVVTGWSALILRRAVQGQESPLPRMDLDFDYLGKLLGIGFKGFLARLLWSLPLVGVMLSMGCLFYIGGIGVIAAVGVAAESGGGEVGAGVGGILMLLMMGGVFIAMTVVTMLAALPVQIAFLRAELTDDLNSAMRFKDVLDMTKLVFKELFIGQFVLGAVGMVAAFVGIFTCYIGLFPALVVVQVINAHYLAAIYKVYLQKGGQPLTVGPLDVQGGDMFQGSAPAQF